VIVVGSYQDFLDRGLPLTRKLLNQGYLATVLFTIYKYRMNYQSLSINKKMSITNRTIKLATADYGNHNHCMSGISALWETQVQRGNNFDVTVGPQCTYSTHAVIVVAIICGSHFDRSISD
jgi:putative component of toxin-antitoxin plasmid stabilization module